MGLHTNLQSKSEFVNHNKTLFAKKIFHSITQKISEYTRMIHAYNFLAITVKYS